MTLTSESSTLLCAASVTGPSHIRRGLPNQDAVLGRSYGYGTVMAAADGVGSQRYAQYGSKAAVRAVQEAFCAYARHSIPRNRITVTITKLYREQVKAQYRSQADTTCLFAAHIYGEGLFLGQIGDGIVAGTNGRTPFILAEKADEFSNIVCPLSCVSPPPKWTTGFIPASKLGELRLMLATDGVSEDLLPEKRIAFAEHLLNRMSGMSRDEQKKYLTGILETWERPGASDDKTILLYRNQGVEQEVNV